MTGLTRRALREQAASSPDTAAVRPPVRGLGRALADVLLWLAAAAGAVCLVLVVLAVTAQITLILFRTGSMSPTIPAGSVAVVQRVPAAQVEVGDVVTVDRPGQLPVTHRVTAVRPGATASERLLTLRGDANTAEDPFPYPVTSVRTVLFSVPGVAAVVVALGDPVVLGALTVAATTLVVWAFWPRLPRRAGPTQRESP
ncbi:signal peptidase I [Microbacterium sp. p3-SID336]|uniref:signal peptidase I n=1 Tax=Microbacterium sp. p3-SID336 TaxID=2916212 RepID=UPI0021A89256|nr:signal peptidase I [Microbacterium sp. p3-SID336]MCT1478158.1 signal peptidase I [Microbacterium sp. p3-SID336]